MSSAQHPSWMRQMLGSHCCWIHLSLGCNLDLNPDWSLGLNHHWILNLTLGWNQNPGWIQHLPVDSRPDLDCQSQPYHEIICSHRDDFQELLFWNHLCPCSLAVAACSSLKRLVIMLVMVLVMRMMMVLMSMVHAHNVHHTSLSDVLSESKEAYMPLYSNLNVENYTPANLLAMAMCDWRI